MRNVSLDEGFLCFCCILFKYGDLCFLFFYFILDFTVMYLKSYCGFFFSFLSIPISDCMDLGLRIL